MRDKFRTFLLKLDKETIDNLCNKEYSKSKLHKSYAILIATQNNDCQILHNRYYTNSVQLFESQYRICNDWRTEDKEKLEKWMNEHGWRGDGGDKNTKNTTIGKKDIDN